MLLLLFALALLDEHDLELLATGFLLRDQLDLVVLELHLQLRHVLLRLLELVCCTSLCTLENAPVESIQKDEPL